MGKGAQRKEGCTDKLAATVDSTVQGPFKKLGTYVGTSPWMVIMISTVATVMCASGISQMTSESRADKLWNPSETASQKLEAKFEVNFPRDGAISYFIAEPKDGSNVLTDACLADLYAIHTEIVALKTPVCELGPDGKPKGTTKEMKAMIEENQCSPKESKKLQDLCEGGSFQCIMSNPLLAWDADLGKPGWTAPTTAKTSFPLTNLNTKYTTEAQITSMFGKPSFAANGDVTAAEAVKIMYFLANDEELVGGGYKSTNNEAWETLFLETIEKWNNKAGSTVKLYKLSTRSFSDEFGSVISGDVGLINGAFMIMIFYLVFNLGKTPCSCPPIQSRMLLSFSSVVAIGMSMGGGFGLAALMGFVWTPVHTVLPFVILGLGVDDSFVIVNALNQQPRSTPIAERMSHALGHAATSISVTSLTDVVAFAISTSSSLPALASFCMFAATSIMLLFILQVTFFSAWLVLDEQRQHNMKVDCCPCCSSCCTTKCGCCRIPDDELEAATAKVQADLKPGRISNYIKDSYAPVIMKTPVRAAIAVLFAGILAVCVNGALKLSVESATKSFIPDGSYLLETMDMMDKYYSNDGTTLYVVTPDNLDVYAERDKIKAIKDKVKANKYLRDPDSSDTYVNWFDEFEAHCSTMSYADCTSSKTTFDSRIKAWLSGQGGKYQMYFKFSGDGKPEGTNEIVSTRIEAEFIGMKKTSNDRMQDDAAEVVKAMEDVQAAKWGIDGAYVFTYQFLEWETYKTIYEELFMNVSLCLVAVLVITTLLIGHPVTSVLVFITVVMTVIDILGCMYYWGLVIDNVSVIQAVIAIGLCVDYAAHVGHCFMLKAGTRSERVIACLADVGAAVLNGGVSTFLAVMLLALSKSYVFRVLFQQFFLTVVFGLAHGMILLPVLLATFGPACYASAEATAAEGAGKVEMSGKGGGPVVDEPTKVMA